MLADSDAETQYLIKRAKLARTDDPAKTKAWILAARTLYPDTFGIQFDAYCFERDARNVQEAAKCFGFILVKFSNKYDPFKVEIEHIRNALDSNTTDKRTPAKPHDDTDFYAQLFGRLPVEQQQQLAVLMVNEAIPPSTAVLNPAHIADRQLAEHIRLLVAIMARYPDTVPLHSGRVLELLVQAINAAPAKSPQARQLCRQLVDDILPSIVRPAAAANDLPIASALVYATLCIVFEHHISEMFAATSADSRRRQWQQLFDTLEFCARTQRWPAFPAYDAALSKDAYWKAICAIVGTAPGLDGRQQPLMFYATVLFVMALETYMLHVFPGSLPERLSDSQPPQFVLVEGVREPFPLPGETAAGGAAAAAAGLLPGGARITATQLPCTDETGVCLMTAANCWQLLHSDEQLKLEFTKMLCTVPLSSWISRFLVDLSFYIGSPEEARIVLSDSSISQCERNVRVLSLLAAQRQPSYAQIGDALLQTLRDLDGSPRGQLVQHVASKDGQLKRHMILLPLTRRAIVQFCTKILVREIRLKVLRSDVQQWDRMLGDLLVLLQLDWPLEYVMAEHLFEVVQQRGSFKYAPFAEYVLCADLIEQFMWMWYPHGGEVALTLSEPSAAESKVARARMGTRGADRGIRDDFKQLMRQQMRKCNDDVVECVERFIRNEHATWSKYLCE